MSLLELILGTLLVAQVQLAGSGHCKPVAPLDTPANAELEMTAPSLIQPLGVVPLLPSPLSPAMPVILPQTPSGTSYAIYLQPAQAQTLAPPPGLSPTVCPTTSSNAMISEDSTDATGESADSDAPKSSASTRPGSLLPGPERQGAKNQEREPAREKGSKRASMLEDSGSKKKFKERSGPAPDNTGRTADPFWGSSRKRRHRTSRISRSSSSTGRNRNGRRPPGWRDRPL